MSAAPAARANDVCQTCEQWGRTIEPHEQAPTVPCPACGRRTWVNLGVNAPAGSAWAYSTVAALARSGEMRDVHGLVGPKKYADTMEEAIALVAAAYPGALREGSIGAWHWYVRTEAGDEVVAEAWIHNTRPGWWLRIKP